MASEATTPAAPAATSAELPEITLYWLDQSRSQRVLWLLEELKLPYKLEIFHRDKKTHLAPPELQKVHALGRAPVITIKPAGSAETVTIAESAVIIEYLIEHFGQNTSLAPQKWKEGQEGKVCGETEEWMRYRYFLHYAEGSLMPLMLVSLIALNLCDEDIKNAPVPFFIKPITSSIAGKIGSGYLDPNFEIHFGFLEKQLETAPGGGGYLTGPTLTGSDVLISFPLIAAKGRLSTFSEAKYPLLWKYTAKLEQEPGYVKAVDKIIELDGSFTAIF